MPNSPYRIRTASKEDVDVITDYNLALCRETEGKELNRETVLEGVAGFFTKPNRGKYYVANKDGMIIGQTAHTFEWSDWRNGDLWWIQSVYVHPEHRGKGVFRSLFNHIKHLGDSDPECCGIRLYMERDNNTARRSYLNLGFKETGYEVFETLL